MRGAALGMITPTLTLLVGAVLSRPAPTNVLFDHIELSPSGAPLPSDGRTLRHNFTFSEGLGRVTEVSYSAVLHDRAFHLDATPKRMYGIPHSALVRHIECHDTWMQLCVDSRDDAVTIAANLQPGDLISGGRHWGCKHPSTGQIGSVQHVVADPGPAVISDPHSIAGVAVKVPVELVGLGRFFKSAQVRFHTTRHPQAQSTGHGEKVGRSAATAPSRALVESSREVVPNGFFGGFFKKIWDGIKTLAGVVEKVVKVVVKVVTFLTTGTLDVQKDFEANVLSWNKAKSDIPLSNDKRIKCKGCYANVNIGIHVDLDIESYTVHTIEAYVEGSVDFDLGVEIDCAGTAKASEDALLDTIKMPTISFYVGPVPITIDLSMPVHAGFEVDLNTQGKVEISSGAHFAGKWGVRYSPSAGLSLIHEVENNVSQAQGSNS